MASLQRRHREYVVLPTIRETMADCLGDVDWRHHGRSGFLAVVVAAACLWAIASVAAVVLHQLGWAILHDVLAGASGR